MLTESTSRPTVAECLEAIQAGIAGLASADFDGYSVAGLGEECRRLLRLDDELKVQTALRLARFNALGGPAGDDTHSLVGWLGRYGRLRPVDARRLAVTAKRLPLLDEAMEAFAERKAGFGDLSTIAEAVDQGARVMDSDWSAERIAEEAQPILLQGIEDGLTPGQLHQAAKNIPLVIDPDEGERRSRRLDRQAKLTCGQTMGGAGVLHGEMGAADYAIVEKALDAYSPRRNPDAPPWKNAAGHRRLKGLIKACEAALASAGENGIRERGGAPVTVHIITTDPETPAPATPRPADADSAAGKRPQAGNAPGRTEFGTILSAADIRDLIMRGGPVRNLIIHLGPDGMPASDHTSDGQPLNWGRRRRCHTPAQRATYLAIYLSCTGSGCDRPIAWCAIDHITEWDEFGRTDFANGQPLCDWHNLHKEHRRKRRNPRMPHRKRRE